MVSNDNCGTDVSSISEKLHFLKIGDIHTFQTAIFMFKYVNKLLPLSFQEFYTYDTALHSYPTRQSSNFHLNNPKTLLTHKSFRHHGPEVWNSLPTTSKNCTSLLWNLKKHIYYIKKTDLKYSVTNSFLLTANWYAFF